MSKELLRPDVVEFTAAERRLLIGGEWVGAGDGSTFETRNPASGEVLAAIAAGGAAEIDAAVAAARSAFEGAWNGTTPSERGQILWRVGQLVRENSEELAQLETLDQGKPLAFARMEVMAAAGIWEYYAGWATKIEGATRQMSVPGMEFHTYSLRQPLGVVGLIIPWNFPVVMASYKVAPAIAVGNAVVLKPAEQTPLTALRLGELCLEAGVPAGVVNVVTGLGETAGAALAAHDGVDKISFTGSTEVGKEIILAARGNLKKVTLELGGKSPNIVFADADLGAAIEGAGSAVFYNQGEVCTAGSRLYVEESVLDQVVEGLKAVAGAFKIGDGLEETTLMGPLISAEHLEKVAGYVDGSREEGAEVVVGGVASEPGYFYEPTIVTGTNHEMAIVREEVFGPVVTVQPFSSEDEVLAEANDSIYGLAGGVWTSDLSKAHRVARRLEAGVVWINCWQMSDPGIPAGGLKQSGWGYDLGEKALDGFLSEKSVVAKL
jgi:phenylacetaldehyde dehydrogenase